MLWYFAVSGARPYLVGQGQEVLLHLCLYAAQDGLAGEQYFLLRLCDEVFNKKDSGSNVPFNFSPIASGVVVPMTATGQLIKQDVSTMTVLQAVGHPAHNSPLPSLLKAY